jgi:hypothetical protein
MKEPKECKKIALINYNDHQIEIYINYKEIDTSWWDTEGDYYRNLIYETKLELDNISYNKEDISHLTEKEKKEFFKWLEDNEEELFDEYILTV